MSWQNLVLYNSREGTGTVLLGVLLGALLLVLWKRSETRSVLTVTILFLIGIAGQLVAAMLMGMEWTTTAHYLHELAILGQGLCLIRLCGLAVFRGILPLLRLTPPHILQDVLLAVIYIVWSLIWLRANGMDPTSLFATSAVLTAVIGLSLQDTLGNIVGGIALEFDQSVRVGDWIQVGDHVGKVIDIGWRQTSFETRNWETVVIPNSMIVKNQVVVLGRRTGEPRQWRRWVWFNVDLTYAPTQVIETVEPTIRSAAIPYVATTPPPNCALMAFADGFGKYAVRYWLTDLAADDPTDSQVRIHIYFALKRAQIPFALPTQGVRLTAESAERIGDHDQASLTRRLKALDDIALLRLLPLEERQQCAAQLIPTPFAQGDILIRQGVEAHSIYFIIDGHADVMVEHTRGQVRKVAALGPGDFFGEIGVIIDAPRAATVIARTAVNCYRLDKTAFREMIAAHAEVAASVSNIIAKRQLELHAVVADLDAEAHARQLYETQHEMLIKIRHFFGLES